MDGLNAVKQEQISTGRQLDHLAGEIQNLDESLRAMHDKLTPLLPPPCPEVAGEDCAKPQQESPLMDIAIVLTSRIRDMNRSVVHVMERIQI